MARMLVERNARCRSAPSGRRSSAASSSRSSTCSRSGSGWARSWAASTPAVGTSCRYAVFVAPALLASSAMNGAVFDSTGNVFFKLKYARLYDSVLATPLGPARRRRRRGHLGAAARCGLRRHVPARHGGRGRRHVVVGRARRCPPRCSSGWPSPASAWQRRRTCARWQDLDLVQLAILPMFLFSATFYPLSTYPRSLQWVVQITAALSGRRADPGARARHGGLDDAGPRRLPRRDGR